MTQEEIYSRFEQMQGQIFFINLALATIAVGVSGLDKNAIPALQKMLASKGLEPGILEELPSASANFRKGFLKQRETLFSLLSSAQ